MERTTMTMTKLLSCLETAKMYAEVLANERSSFGKTKDILNRVANRCQCAQKDITDMFDPDVRAIVKERILKPDAHLQIDGIMDALVALPPRIRDEVETYIMQRKNVYAKD